MDSAYLSAIAELEYGGDEIHGYSGEKLKDVVLIRDVDFAHEESEVECGREYDEEAENYFLTVHAMPRFAGYPRGEGGRKNRPRSESFLRLVSENVHQFAIPCHRASWHPRTR